MHMKGFLFDLDGTLIDSLEPVERAWRAWATRHGLNGDEVMEFIHGRPARESVGHLLEGASEMEINAEFGWLEKIESEDTQGVKVLPGAMALLQQLNVLGIKWGIVTSGSDPVAIARVKAAGLPTPETFVTANQISKGKPNPEPFLLGAERLGLEPADCVVVEDAPAGVQAGAAAGAMVLALDNHYKREQLSSAHHFIHSLEQVEVVREADGFELRLNNES